MRPTFILYMLGYLLIIGGVGYALHLAGIPIIWTWIVSAVLGGAGLIFAVSNAEREETARTKAENAD